MYIHWPLLVRGATAYEWQVGKVYGHIVHLRGAAWPWWAPWRRFSVYREKP